MKNFLRKLISFLQFLAIGLVVDLLLGLFVGTIFYLVRDKKLTEVLDIVFSYYLISF